MRRVTTPVSLCALVALLMIGACSASKGAKSACDQGSFCRDSDCDTLCDADEGTDDLDGDGVPNYLDEDSDGDGVPDIEEAGDEDPATPPIDRNQNGVPDFLEPGYPLRADRRDAAVLDSGLPRDGGMQSHDAALLDGSGHYDVDAAVDVDRCPATSVVPAGCVSVDDSVCDPLDQDCDGNVVASDLCPCERGTVRACFLGPPGRRGVGACRDGVQVCLGEEFSLWSPCTGSTGPSTETCDGLDNDCNGCTDELSDCDAVLDCPAPGDPRIAPVSPYTTLALDGSAFYTGDDATAWRWKVQGSPCDALFQRIDTSATSSSGKLSYTLNNASSQSAGVALSLSGDYAVTLEVDTPDGPLTCNWVQPVRAPGLRVELCWDNTGPKADAEGGLVDLDLHLGKQGSTSSWGASNDCHWLNCKGANTPWSYANTDLSRCAGAQNGNVYQVLGYCPNPRLDADARLDAASRARYVTENINLDAPAAGDQFRIAVAYNTNAPSDALGPDAGSGVPVETHPLVNVYCGGARVGSLGGDADVLVGFERPAQLWRVADVSFQSGGGTASCSLAPLSDPVPGNGYYLTDGDSTY